MFLILRVLFHLDFTECLALATFLIQIENSTISRRLDEALSSSLKLHWKFFVTVSDHFNN